jgi:hypothetical protein
VTLILSIEAVFTRFILLNEVTQDLLLELFKIRVSPLMDVLEVFFNTFIKRRANKSKIPIETDSEKKSPPLIYR